MPHQIAKHRSWAASLLAIAVLLSGAGLVTGGVWLSIQLFLNPDALIWGNQLLPKWAQIPVVSQEQPQTLAQIQVSLSHQGMISGEPLSLEANVSALQAKSILLPIRASQSKCYSNCEQILELRAYQVSSVGQNGETYYQLVDQLPIEGLDESFVLAPLVDPEAVNQGSNRPLPLSEVHRFEGSTPSQSGVWLYLRGQGVPADEAIAYGQIVHYNPRRTYLSTMLSWTSPTGKVPQWQQVTGSGSLELVVDQTIDLEPQLRVYQIKPLDFVFNPIQLEPISLTEPALKEPAYQKALLIARSGLWSPASKWLQFIKRQHQGRMPAAAQAQMEVIRLHAQITHSQAEKTWASPSQEVLADLIDGRWAKALQVFQQSPENTQEIALLLEEDSERLWHRVEAALRVNPARTEVKAWGALIKAAQQEQSAKAWLKQQPKTTSDQIAYIQILLRRLEGDFSTPTTLSSHPSRIIGSVEPVTKLNLEQWLQPNPKVALNLADGQWYQLQISAYHDGKNWQQQPFTNLKLPKTGQAVSLWQQLGLDSNSQIQIVVWLPDGQQQMTTATVKAVQLQGKVLRLLVVTSAQVPRASLRPRPLAFTEAALQWVESDPITLAELNQREPLKVRAMLPVLWRELQQSSQSLKKPAAPSFEQMLKVLGHWPVQSIDLTGNNLPEAVLTVSEEAITSQNSSDSSDLGTMVSHRSQSRTIIFSDSGTLIYNELGTASNRSVTAIATHSAGEPPALLVEDSDNYILQRWSSNRQRFE